jgi:UDP-GlcNAc:undecaprenyl-phosphate GlcNAc-1-phosphate transferase
MNTFTVVFALAAALALAMTPLIVRFAEQRGFVDRPGARKVHRHTVPRIGGIAIFAPTIIATLPVLFLANGVGDSFRQVEPQVLTFFGACLVIFAMGLLDDVRTLRARHKFLVQFAAATACFAAGIRIEELSLFELGTYDLGWMALPITLVWIVGVTNAVNLIDGLDGLAAGICAITCAVLALFAIHSGDVVMAVLTLGLLGSLVGFLFFNFNPARIFMGDSGSQFLGFAIATAGVLTYNKATTAVALSLPVLALGVPIFDTILSMLRRYLGRRSMFGPDRGHIHHRLLERGFGHRATVLTLYAITAMGAGVGVAMTLWRDAGTIILFVASLVFLLFAFRLSGVFRVRGTIEKIQANQRRARRARDEKQHFEEALLKVGEASTFDEWWSAVADGARALGFAELSLAWHDRLGNTQRRDWLNPTLRTSYERQLRVTLPLRDRRKRSQLTLEAFVDVGVTLETAGQRVTHLTRLLDESGFFPPVEELERRLAPELATPAWEAIDQEISGPVEEIVPAGSDHRALAARAR